MDDEALISLVQKYRLLYDKTAPHYKDKDAKEMAWEAISTKMQIPAEPCMKRWNTLRERFTREVRLLKSENDEKAPWRLNSAMSFLQPHIIQRRSKSMLNAWVTSSPKVKLAPFEVMDELDCSVPTSLAANSECRSSSPGDFSDRSNSCSPQSSMHCKPELKPSSSLGKRKLNESAVDNAILEALETYKKICCQNNAKCSNVAVESFGRMITASINEMSAAKQTKAIKEVTALVSSIKEEQESSLHTTETNSNIKNDQANSKDTWIKHLSSNESPGWYRQYYAEKNKETARHNRAMENLLREKNSIKMRSLELQELQYKLMKEQHEN